MKHTNRLLLHVHPYNEILVHEIYLANREERLNFVDWYLHAMHDGEYAPQSLCLATNRISR